MRLLKSLKKLIQSADLFGTTEFFRFKSQTTFQSLFGGIVSLLIVAILGIIFYNRIVDCLKKAHISSTQSRIVSALPPPLEMSTFPKGTFMAAIEISGFNAAQMAFSFFEITITYGVGVASSIKGTTLQLEPCTATHWSGVPEIADDLQFFDISRMLCIPMNFEMFVSGKATSDINYFVFEIKKRKICSTKAIAIPRCPTASEILSYFGNQKLHKIQLYYINYQVTPNKPNHLNPFIDDRYFCYFSATKGTYTNLMFQDFTMKTDEGIGVFQYPVVETGGIVDQPVMSFQYLIVSRYASFLFAKSLTSRIYQRSFQKISDVLSFIGCLYGIICSAMFIVKFYNNTAYSISLGAELFESSQIKQKGFFKKYTFLNFLKQVLYKLLLKVGFKLKWSSTAEYESCEKQGAKYFDILHLVKRLMFLENSVSIILDKHQKTGLHLKQRLSLEEAEKKRELANFKKQVKKIRNSIAIKRGSLVCSKNENQSLNQLQMEGLNSKNEDMIKNLSAIKDQTFLNSQNQNQRENESDSFSSQSSDESPQQSQVIQQKPKQRKSANYDEIISDLSKIQQEAKDDKRISKRIMRLSGFALQGIPQNSQLMKLKNQNSLREYINPITLNSNRNEESLAELRHQAQELKIQADQQENQQKIEKTQEPSKKSPILSSLALALKSIDIFSATNFIQYRSDLKHKTLFGGVISILMLGIVLSLFYQKLNDCLSKNTIYSSSTKKFSNDPSYFEISTPPKGNFMVSIEIQYTNITIPESRIFDFTIENRISKLNESTGKYDEEVISYSLEPCTLNHWDGDAELRESIKSIEFNRFLCLPLGITLSIQGRKNSKQFQTIQFAVKKCKNQTDPTRPCDQNRINKFMINNTLRNMWFRLNSVVLNAQSSKYSQYYLEERAYMFFSVDMISVCSIYIDDYQVITDQSIFPWKDEKIQTGGTISTLPVITSYQNINNTDGYIRMNVYKSFISFSYYRSYEKIENVFAFIRGIFGIFFAGLFIVNSYNTMTYEVSFCSKILKSTKTSKPYFDSFNFFTFIKKSIHGLISKTGFTPKWDTAIECQKYQQEMERQIDVPSVFKRLDFLECSIETILEDHEIIGLRLKQKPSIDESKENRKAFKLKKLIYRMARDGQKGCQAQVLSKQKSGQPFLRGQMRDFPFDMIKDGEAIVKESDMKGKHNTDKSNIVKSDEEENKNEEERFSQVFSSDSEDEQDICNQQKHKDMLMQIKKLKEQAAKGEKISEKIMQLANKSVLSLVLKKLTENAHKKEEVDQSEVKVKVTELNGQQPIEVRGVFSLFVKKGKRASKKG